MSEDEIGQDNLAAGNIKSPATVSAEDYGVSIQDTEGSENKHEKDTPYNTLLGCQTVDDVQAWMEENRNREGAEALLRVKNELETDPLTGLPNRRGWARMSEVVMANLDRSKAPVDATVMMIDLERLKFVNDTAGYEAGNHYVQIAGQAIQKVLRKGDVGARIGGDEFPVLLPGANSRQARAVKDRIIKAFRRSIKHIPEGSKLRQLPLGLSVGIQQIVGDNTVESSLERAAETMKREKKSRGAERKD
jgi:diguanylate cyclase (GGDEF)-like protein